MTLITSMICHTKHSVLRFYSVGGVGAGDDVSADLLEASVERVVAAAANDGFFCS